MGVGYVVEGLVWGLVGICGFVFCCLDVDKLGGVVLFIGLLVLFRLIGGGFGVGFCGLGGKGD